MISSLGRRRAHSSSAAKLIAPRHLAHGLLVVHHLATEMPIQSADASGYYSADVALTWRTKVVVEILTELGRPKNVSETPILRPCDGSFTWRYERV